MTAAKKILYQSSWYGPQLADCDSCELSEQCEAKKFCTADIGEHYKPGGIMIIGEGAGTTEVSQGKPFVGRAGRLLDGLLESAGIERSHCWITNATLCLPPYLKKAKGGLHQRFPRALESCLSRLEEEIKAAQPRVIITLGMPALCSLTGHDMEKVVQTRFECENEHCDPKTRRIGPGFECALGDCDWFESCPHEYKSAAAKQWRTELIEGYEGVCPYCKSSIKKLQVKKNLKCRSCGGKKMRQELKKWFQWPKYTMFGRKGVAGAVFKAADMASRLDEFGVKYVIPTYHPAYCLRSIKAGQGSGDNKRIGGQFAARATTMHMEKARELLSRDAVFDAIPISTADPDFIREWLAEAGTYAVDIETNNKKGPWGATKITCIGFARADRKEALVVDTYSLPNWWEVREGSADERLLDALHWFLSDPTKGKVLHNGIFDLTVIRRLWGIDVENVVCDTLIAHTNCWPDEEHSLNFVAHELLDMPHWKDDRQMRNDEEDHELSGYEDWEELAQYNANDTRSTILVDECLRGADAEHGWMATDGVPAAFEVDMAMFRIAFEMQWNGMPMSNEARGNLREGMAKERDTALAAMRNIVRNEEFKPTGEQLLWTMYSPDGPLNLPVPGWTDGGKSGDRKASTNKDDLRKLADQPFVQYLLQWRKHDYYISHYLDSDQLKPAFDGRIHPEWKPWGARTGRWSSSPNFQNWPKIVRTAIIAPPGRKFVGADYSQLELRIMAALSGDEKLIELCINADESDKLNPDCDPHSYVAFRVYGDTYMEAFRHSKTDKKALEKAKLLRDIVKRVVYGLNYGAGANTVLEAIYNGGYEGPPIKLQQIQRVTKIYFETFPKVLTWRNDLLRASQEQLKVTSPILHRHRIFPLPPPWGGVDATVAYNYPIQAGGADIMNMRLMELDKVLYDVDPTAMLIAQVHDAIYAECAEDKAQDVARCIEETLTVELTLAPGAPSMPFPASAAIADNWKEAA